MLQTVHSALRYRQRRNPFSPSPQPMAAPPPENENAFKHQFGRDLLRKIAAAIAPHHPAFDSRTFLQLTSQLEPLEMKDRVRLLRDELRQRLPEAYPQALAILLKSVRGGGLDGFALWPVTEFVQTYGLDFPVISLDALKYLTTLFTSEWAVRPFIKKYPAKTLRFLLRCAGDKHVAVRRWASEGSRPRLPWGERLQEFVRDPKPTLPILERLKTDPELFVRTSVANHLNDIAKDHADDVVKILRRWKKTVDKKDAAKIDWIARRALRTLIKSGHPGALAFIGVSRNAQVAIRQFQVKQKRIKVGDRLEFEIELGSSSAKTQKVVLDYIVHFMKANRATTPKVFKLKTFNLLAGQNLRIRRSHHFKKITTRSYYPGLHALELQVNGAGAGKREWTLDV
ncbi:MAG: alkylation repair enzyme [Verrucomicrobia bacterium]|nr:alkylation repair enzyme [Verrucomicrobiota bacterium]